MSRLLLDSDATKVVYIGLSGRVWHLSGPNHGLEGVRLGTGPGGLLFGPFDNLWSEGARQDGATWLRSVRSKRELDLVAQVQGSTTREFRSINHLWWNDWSPNERGVLGIYTKNMGWRYLRVRLGEPPEPVQDKDPALINACDYQFVAIADDPLYAGLPERDLWRNTLGINEGVLYVRNDADQEVWPQYVMNGPGRFYIEDPMFDPSDDEIRIIQTPMLLAGEELMIDTHPRRRTARIWSDKSGANVRNVWAQLGGRRWFFPVKAESVAEITVRVEQGNTASSVAVVALPRHTRPW